MNKEKFVDNFSIDLTNSTVAERKKYAEKIFDKIDSLQQQVYNLTLEFNELKNEKAEIKKYLGISSKTIMQRLEELQEYKDEMKVREDNYKQALNEIETYQKRNCETCVFANTQKCNVSCQIFVILDIINKAKDGE